MGTHFQLPPHSPPSCSSSRVDYFHFRIRPRARVGFACPFSYSLAEIFSSKHYIFLRDYMFRSVLRLNTFWDVRSFWTNLSSTKNHSIYLQHPMNDPGTKSCNKALSDCRYCWQASGGSRGGARPPPRLSQGLDDRPHLPSPPTYLKVRIRHYRPCTIPISWVVVSLTS